MGLMRLHTWGPGNGKPRRSHPSRAVMHSFGSEPIFVTERLKPREKLTRISYR